MKRTRTMNDVAREANTAVATVSRVVNNVGYVSDGLRQRVQEAIERLAYVPNANARALKTSVSRTIGIVIGDLLSPYAIELANAVTATMAAEGYTTFIGTAVDDAASDRSVIEAFHRQRVDGIVVATLPTPQSDEAVARLARDHVPIVLVGRSLPGRRIDSVSASFREGGEMATQHLLDLGHRRVAFVGAQLDDAPRILRLAGYVKALKAAGVPVRADHVLGDPGKTGSPRYGTQATGYQATKRLLKMSPRPTAIFARNDHIAFGVLQALSEEGLRVPTDMSVVGFDNIPRSRDLVPGLSTVAQPNESQGQLAAEFLLDRITHPGQPVPPRDVVLECTLIVRGSTTDSSSRHSRRSSSG